MADTLPPMPSPPPLSDEHIRARRAQLENEGWLPARFRGRCGMCGNRFEEGTMLTKHRFGWVADCCYDNYRQGDDD